MRFLGYDVRTYTGNRLRKVKRRDSAYHTLRRTVAKDGQLHGPMEKVRMFCQRKGSGDFGRLRPLHKPAWQSRSDVEIMHAYHAEVRGFANYYSRATEVKQPLNRLEYLWKGSLLKTLANQHKTRVGQRSKKLKQGRDYVYHYRVQGSRRQLKLYALKTLKKPAKHWPTIDVESKVAQYTLSRTEIVQRLHAHRCEYCGTKEGGFAVHHVRKLTDLHGKEHWQQIMAAMRRKTLVRCHDCHQLLHSGALPDWRYRRIERRAGFRENVRHGTHGANCPQRGPKFKADDFEATRLTCL